MQNTSRKHWVNGHQIRGGWFHTFNFSLGGYGFMLCWGTYGLLKANKFLTVFKLI